MTAIHVGLIAIGVQLLMSGATIAMFCVIKFNDMKHIEESGRRIEKRQEKHGDTLDEFGERISKIEGKLEV